ncbi:MAG: aminotransferase [SAR324 cluster bacterium]|uniref:Aminotransferase n=1 Tax=SAR324 cluster bacterium TaxID=2024889 RepID=A0A2A4T7N3_9DELT|nr:MAG: aminotransferase [SAR324 cluster bacterium]
MNPSATLTPPFTSKEVQDLVRQHYGIQGTIEDYPSYIDRNFLLRSDTGEKYVVKLANQNEDSSTLDFQNKAMEHLAAHMDPSAWPGVCTSLEGKQIHQVTSNEGSSYLLRVLTFVPGTCLADISPQTPELLQNIGHFLGETDRAFVGFSHPASSRYLQWDLKNASDIKQYLPHIKNPEKRGLVEFLLQKYESEIKPLLPALRCSVIHNDGNDYNLLMGGQDSQNKVVGLIDFGDIVHTQLINELAVALPYLMFGKEDPLSAAAQVISGYHQEFPLKEEEIRVLFYLICMRLCTSVCMSAHQKSLEPDNEYLLVSEKPAWQLLEMLVETNPNLVYRIFKDACGMYTNSSGIPELNHKEILEARQSHLNRALSVSYEQPLKIVRGSMQYLYDECGTAYLDLVNNVCHVGHCHPRVVRAAQDQISRLNTNTRYLHDNIVEYAKRLTATLPDPLNVCFLVCTGSEANDLALRLARTHTGNYDALVVDGAYHGNLSSLIDLSPYKFDGPGGQGTPIHTHKVTMPDPYRGKYKADDPKAGEKYAAELQDTIEEVQEGGRNIAAFFCESLLGCGGQIVLPDNYMKEAFHHVREAGGLCIADEVQVGFGRVGEAFWGFQTQDVIPDIVTFGKPIGNGHPMAAVVTTAEIAASFNNGMEYFNTFGGNPVSCAIGLAVLDVIESEGLQQNALEVGNRMKQGLEELKKKHPIIGDVRGMGLFLGVELVLDRQTLEPAAQQASWIAERMKERQILISTDGPLHNVLKIKPPIVCNMENADSLICNLDQVLSDPALMALSVHSA